MKIHIFFARHEHNLSLTRELNCFICVESVQIRRLNREQRFITEPIFRSASKSDRLNGGDLITQRAAHRERKLNLLFNFDKPSERAH